jgi:hypothetical protein
MQSKGKCTMKSAILKPRTKAKTKDRIARWVSFAALVALLAMATLPLTSGQRPVAVQNSTHWSHSWHG